MKKPLFSVLIPVFKIEKYIEECVFSITNQSFSDFEIIDNTGTKSSFDAKGWGENIAKSWDGWYVVKNVAAEKYVMNKTYYSGTGIFSPLVANSRSFKELFSKLYDEGVTFVRPLSDEDKIEWYLNVLIPKGDISKYSSFTIQHKSK